MRATFNLKKHKILFACLAAIICGSVFFAIKSYIEAPQEPAIVAPAPPMNLVPQEPLPTPQPNTQVQQDTKPIATPHGKLLITQERQEYKDRQLGLRIPKLKLNEPIYGGTEPNDLKKGVCLYDYAQLPAEGDRNVSLAAHRNGRRAGIVNDNAPFYYIDQLKDGDYMYLTDSNNIYKYIYHSTEIVEEDDWKPIYSQGFSCLTLTSCEPIGINTHRIIVRGMLEEIIPIAQDYDYKAEK